MMYEYPVEPGNFTAQPVVALPRHPVERKVSLERGQ